MDLEDAICRHYEAMLASIAFLGRDYYLNESPTLAEHAAYSARKQQLEAIRSRFYSELDAIHRGTG
jgi:hypothetical protein